jgi:phosphatidylserine decarboxylase
MMALMALSFYFGWVIPGLLLLLLAAFVAFFFRNPDREIPNDPESIVSPADGKVIQVVRTEDFTRVSIFLSVFNVHVNRAPIDGLVTAVDHRPGRFLLAFDERASVENEQVVFRIRGQKGIEFEFALIAGLVARRIIPWKKVGERVEKGERIALIRFGSRADILIPSSCRTLVSKGESVRAGSSVLASWKGEF